MSPTTSTPVLRISAAIAVTWLDSTPAGCTTLAASLSFISCSGLRCDCGELIMFSTLGSAFDPSRYDTTQDQCMSSNARFANPTGQPQMFVIPEPRMPRNSPAHEADARERIFHVHFALGRILPKSVHDQTVSLPGFTPFSPARQLLRNGYCVFQRPVKLARPKTTLRTARGALSPFTLAPETPARRFCRTDKSDHVHRVPKRLSVRV